MPDFRQAIEQANFKPTYTTNSTTGPNAEGQEQTWVNPNPQLEQSSAQELASLLGATMTEVNYSGGPYSQQKPQYQLDFGMRDDYDASMTYDRYQKNPAMFNQQEADEFKTSQGPSVAQAEFDAGRLGGGHPLQPGAPGGTAPRGMPDTIPGAGAGIGGSGTGTPYVSPDPNKPGPNNWPKSPDPNKPGPIVPVNPLPGPTGIPAVTPTGTEREGGYTSPARELPRQSSDYGLLLNTPYEIKGYEPTVTTPPAMDPIKMPGLLSSATPGGYTPPAYNKGKGLLSLGMRNADNTPMTPQQLLEFGQTGKIPTPNDKEPLPVEATMNYYNQRRAY